MCSQQKIEPENIKHILIRAANWVGDAVMSTPMIRAVRMNFPSAEVSILAKPWVAPVFENNPDIDHILIYDAGGCHRGWQGILRLSASLKNRFDMAVLVQNAFEAALISYLAGIPHRVGYDTDGRTLLLTHPVPMRARHKKRHQIDYYLGITQGISLKTCGRNMTLIVSQEERAAAERMLNAHAVITDGPVIGINPGAAYGSAKRWFPDRYGELCARVQERFCGKAVILVFGGPGEESLGQQVCRMAGPGSINLCGKTTLREAVALIEQCRIFITNDSGLMHIASALDIPQIAIFGPTNHITTSPAGLHSHMARVPAPCSPCLKPECPLGHHQCMKSVTVDMVFEKALSLLAGIGVAGIGVAGIGVAGI
jgi:heptosyltransferase-2